MSARRFAPRLEVLDERSLPSVSYAVQGTFLFVTGDAGANTVTITDAGTATGIEVIGDGVPFTATSPITHVFVDTLDGNDTVVYNLTADLTAFRLVDAQLGRGADSYVATISGRTIAPDVNLDLSANGGGGGDAMTLNAQNVTTAGALSVLNVDFSGDAGKDQITFDYTAAIQFGIVTLTKDQKR